MNYKSIRNKFSIILQSILNLKDDYSFIGRFLVFGYQSFYSIIFKIEKKILLLKNRLKYGKLYFDEIYWIEPKKIQYLSKRRYNKWFDYSRILGGDWDLSTYRFEDDLMFRAFKQRFNKGKNWEDTEYYKQGIKIWGYNKKKMDNMFRAFELIYYEIKKNGYKLKRELSSSKRGFKNFNFQTMLDEISVDIGRNGQFLVLHGKHRLAISQLLDIPRIPVIIIKRHKKWMYFRRDLIFLFRNYQNNKHDHVLNHPDLQNIPFKQGNIPFNIIRENISISRGTLLDINANLGYFCHKFEDEGFNCYASEENKLLRYLLTKLKMVENKKFKIIKEPILNYKDDQEITFDVVLALKKFQDFIKREDTYVGLIKFLKRLRVKELIIGIHNSRDFQNKNFYQNCTPEAFISFILENSCLNKARLISKTKNDRYIYKLTSENLSS